MKADRHTFACSRPGTYSRRRLLESIALIVAGSGAGGQASAQGRANAQPGEAGIGRPIAGDERVDLFVTAARRSADGDSWLIPVEGRVFRPERSVARLAVIRRLLEARWGIVPDRPGRDILERRINLLLGDGLGGRSITIEVAGSVLAMPPSEPSGRLSGMIEITQTAARASLVNGQLPVRVRPPERDARLFESAALMVPPHGVSVISDVDDTVKITGVGDRRRLLETSLVRPFEAVPGMARLYQGWAAEGAAFHFVSTTPWQLHSPLSAFLAGAGFPPATLDLKVLSFNDRTILDLLASPLDTKPPRIESLIDAFPQRRFVLVGDSGEKDPEIYADIARRRPGRVSRILIRNVTGARADDARMSAAFSGIDRSRWQLFYAPTELPQSLR